MTDNNINIAKLAEEGYLVNIENFSEQDQKLISRIFNLNEKSTDKEFEAVGLKKDNSITIKNKNNEDVKYKNYDNKITKLMVPINRIESNYLGTDYYILFTKKGIVIQNKKNEKFTKIEEYSGDLIINLISKIFRTNFVEEYIPETKYLIYSNLLKYTSQSIADINVEELQDLISNSNYDKNREAIDFLMKAIVRSGENIEAFKFLFEKYFNDKSSKLKLVNDVFAGGNYDMIHILYDNFDQQLLPEEKFQFVSNSLVGAYDSGKYELLEYVLDNYSNYLDSKLKETEKYKFFFEVFRMIHTNKNKELFEVFLSKYKKFKILNAIISDEKERVNELFEKIGNPEIANLLLNELLKIGFDFDTRKFDNNQNNNIKYATKTALHCALENENLEIAKLLLNQLSYEKLTELANIKTKNELMLFDYNKITKKENLEIAKLLFSIKDFDINARDTKGSLPIYSAAENNNIELFKFLLSNPKIDVNEYYIIDRWKQGYDNIRETVLDFVAQWGDSNRNEILKLLLNRAELKISANNNEDLVERLEKSEDNELNELIINHSNFNINAVINYLHKMIFNYEYNGYTVLTYFIKKERKDIVELLLKSKRLDVNKTDEGHMTPLYLAVELENKDIVKLLVNNDKIDINKKSGYLGEEIILELAIVKKNEEILRILLSNKNIDVNCVENEKDKTLLYRVILAMNNAVNINELRENEKKIIDFYKKTISLLFAHKNLDTNLEYNKSYTFLSETIEKKNIWLTDFLLSQPKIKEDIQKGDGVKLLNKAIEAGNSEIIGLLISKDEINLNTPDENGKTAIQFAISFGKEKIFIEAIKNAKELIRNDFNTLDEANKKIKEEKLKLLEEIENEFSGEKQMSI